ncbi:MAG TPA: ATP-grasp domain-containing protein [Burkholderiales bacterium]|nr:ATP-grasp domain-containing protein [Burkholderiales bacterium]
MRALPENLPLLLVSASGRALAQSAARAGVRAVVLDLFNDLDVRAVAVASRRVAAPNGKFDSRQLIAAAQELCPPETCSGLVYGSGFEGRTRLLKRLSNGRTLFGNPPDTVAALKDPARFFPLLDRLGIAHPDIRLEPPADVAGWLVKRNGGAGGRHVRKARQQHRANAQRYFQRFQPGRTLSVLFAADGHHARVVGFNEQWTAGVPHGAPYCYGGAVSQPPLPRQTQRRIAGLLDDLVQVFGLVGLNGLDFILAGETPSVLEINPRPTATIDLYDVDIGGGMLALHLRACRGELPDIPVVNIARAHAIVYAAVALRVPVRIEWPEWCTDLPESGSVIPMGAPVCSVHAAAATSAGARELVLARRSRMEESLLERAA